MAEEFQYQWTDNPTVSGVAECNTDILNDCLMHLKYDKKEGGAGLDGKITNCLLEVPQKINLELVDGTLTLKAGSVVIVPNGFEEDGVTKKFEEVTITKDLSLTPSTGFGTGAYFIAYSYSHGYLSQGAVKSAISGGTAPTTTHTLWYNTTDNIIDRTGSDSALYNQQISFPIAVAQVVNGVAEWVSIDQVFNGFGYIGNHCFTDKGVKGLIPNGRNADGSLNNIEYTQQSVKVEYCANNNNHSYIEGIGTGVTQSSYYVEQEEEPTTNYTLWYKPSENKMYRKSGSGVVTENKTFVGFEVTTGDNGITSLQPKQPFHAVDHNELQEVHCVVETYVNGESWYRVWSDGWCEQGGSKPASTAEITFLKPFINLSYYWNLYTYKASYSGGAYCYYSAKTASSITTLQTSEPGYWYACGYIS